jgi:hypothetical protein
MIAAFLVLLVPLAGAPAARAPIDLLADHRVAEVVAAIEQEQNDSYA